MSEPKGWKEIPIGGLIVDAGNAVEYETGSWRSQRPLYDGDKCIQCLRCWILCPDSAITITEEGKRGEFDLVHCKGCGLCAEECPDKVQAITMKLEKEL